MTLRLLTQWIAAAAIGGGTTINVEVICTPDCPEYQYVKTDTSAYYFGPAYTDEGIRPRVAMGAYVNPSVLNQTSWSPTGMPLIYLEKADPDWQNPPHFRGTAIFEGTFALTITLAEGGTGYFLPCMFSPYDVGFAEGTLAGIEVSSLFGPTDDSCSYSSSRSNPYPVSAALPFESGVPQLIEGAFIATGALLAPTARPSLYLYDWRLFDENRNPISWGAYPLPALRIEPVPELVPEPATLTAVMLALGGFATAKAFRFRRRAADLAQPVSTDPFARFHRRKIRHGVTRGASE